MPCALNTCEHFIDSKNSEIGQDLLDFDKYVIYELDLRLIILLFSVLPKSLCSNSHTQSITSL